MLQAVLPRTHPLLGMTVRRRPRRPDHMVERGQHDLPCLRTGAAGRWDRLPGRKAERFGVGPTVVLGQDLAEAARPVGNGLATDLAACHRKMGHGHREAAGLLQQTLQEEKAADEKLNTVAESQVNTQAARA